MLKSIQFVTSIMQWYFILLDFLNNEHIYVEEGGIKGHKDKEFFFTLPREGGGLHV